MPIPSPVNELHMCLKTNKYVTIHDYMALVDAKGSCMHSHHLLIPMQTSFLLSFLFSPMFLPFPVYMTPRTY